MLRVSDLVRVMRFRAACGIPDHPWDNDRQAPTAADREFSRTRFARAEADQEAPDNLPAEEPVFIFNSDDFKE